MDAETWHESRLPGIAVTAIECHSGLSFKASKCFSRVQGPPTPIRAVIVGLAGTGSSWREPSKLLLVVRNSEVISSLARMDKEKRALLEQAARCRSAADDMDYHNEAAKKLTQMAMEYESRAAGLEEARLRAELPGRRRRAKWVHAKASTRSKS
jgi:hypothetical protein